MKVELRSGTRLVLEDLGRCPCGEPIAASLASDPPCVAHAEPRCAAFDRLDALAFLRYVRRSRGISDWGEG